MALRTLARSLADRLQPATAGPRQVLSQYQLAAPSFQADLAESPKWRWSLDAWVKAWQESSWLAVPKKKVSPHRRGMRNAGKHQKLVPVVARCKECNKAFPIHQLARCKAENCPGRFSQAV